MAKLYPMIDLIRCCILIITVSSITACPFFAVLIMISSSVSMSIYGILVGPWTSISVNRQSIFNEGILNGIGSLMLASKLNIQTSQSVMLLFIVAFLAVNAFILTIIGLNACILSVHKLYRRGKILARQYKITQKGMFL